MTYIFSVIILAVVVVTFIALPYYRRTARSTSIDFGSYNGQAIKYQSGDYFAQERNILAQQLQNQGQNLNQQAKTYEIWRGAFERTVIHTAIMQAALRSGVDISTSRLDKTLTQYGPYTVNGKFSAQAYDQTSSQRRAQIRSLVRQELIGQTYQTDVLNGEKSSTQAKQFLAKMASPERNFRFVGYNMNTYPASEVVKFGKANKRQFQTIRLSRITVKSGESAAKAILTKLKTSPNLFGELARSRSTDAYASKGGSMGTHTYANLKPNFESQSNLNKLFKMKSGQISGVIRAPFGWTIYRVDRAARQPDFTDPHTINTVRSYMERYDHSKIDDYFVKRAKAFASQAGKLGFAGAASAQKLTVHTTGYFPINYGNSFFLPQIKSGGKGLSLAQAANNATTLQRLFGMKIGSISKPMTIGNDVFVVDPVAQRSAPAKMQKDISQSFSLIEGRFIQSDLFNEILSSNKLNDNFNQTFAQRVNPSTPAHG